MRSSDQEWRHQQAALTRRAHLFGALAVIALVIGATNLLALIHAFWQPMGVFNMPLYLLFAVTALWAAVNFLRTRRRALAYRDHPERFSEE
ncbi:hypothetical protein HRbin10_00760 [bacterium HR10]|uniref:Uncharacterized protein n=1 Tax=uncultured Acidobacteriota bacterium TaxID=171953 RepID=H5SPR2_9BACT|nr:hypothetical protein HGMM_F54F02C31 [uncultured Acidobacteriota bacterium]GBC81648.1 hypothetical protein HRbin10_00760 [bacterium HR10]